MIRLSPSNLDRYRLCPGAYWAEVGLPYTEHDGAGEGKLMHAVLAGSDSIDKLTPSQRADYNFCQREAKRLHEEIFGTDYRAEVKSWRAESRLQAKVESDVLLSGQVDYWAWGIVYDVPVALVIDWKFGRGEIDTAAENLQTRAYAVLVDVEVPGSKPAVVYVAIIQPRADIDSRVTVSRYTPEDIDRANDELKDIAAAIRLAETQPMRYPGREQCKYCKALGTIRCPESAETARALAPIQYADVMPHGADLAAFLDKAAVAKKLIDRLEEYAKERLADGEEVPGWTLKPGPPIRTLPDTAKAWECAQRLMEPEDFLRCCKVTIGALQDALQEQKGWTTRQAKDEFNALMAAAIVMQDKAPSLVREK